MLPKESFYFTLLDKLKAGSYPARICKDLNISKQNLNYYLRKLKDLGHIEKKGYGVWEVKTSKNSTKDTSKTLKQIRGHAFIWSIKIPRDIRGWKQRKQILSRSNISFKEVGLAGTPRIFIKNRKVWLGNNTITIYEPKSFYGDNAIESKKYAVIGLIEVLKALENKLNINLKPYTFKPSREHYGILRNDLAAQCNRTGEKIYIRDDAGDLWLWVDNSFNLHELETGGIKALPTNLQVQNWFNDHKKNDFKVTPSFVLNTMNGIQQNQLIFAKNMKSHIAAIQKLGNEVEGLAKAIKKFKE